MGHTWEILEPSCLTLKRRNRWKSRLFHRVASYSCGHLSVFYTLSELKEFEDAGCSIWFDGIERSEWSHLWEEIEQTENKHFDVIHRGQITINGITFVQY